MKTWKIIVGVLCVWLFIMVYMSNTLFQSSDTNNSDLERQLKRALRELDKLKLQNDEFRGLVKDIKNIQFNPEKSQSDDEVLKLKEKLEMMSKKQQAETAVSKQEGKQQCKASRGLTLDHEVKRRKVENDATEFWYFMRSELKKLISSQGSTNPELSRNLNQLLKTSNDYQRTMSIDMLSFKNVDGNEEFRLKESKELGEIVQRRIRYLQNPKDCSKAKKVVCNLSKGCGFGCQLHHVSYCLTVAYATGRTLILESKGWRYAGAGWESVFRPLSDTCTNKAGSKKRHWAAPDIIENYQVVEMPIIDSLHPRPPFLPLSFPKDLSERLLRLHGNPPVWWLGQFVKYLTRPQQHLQEDLEKARQKFGFSNPCVGVHVRRTDKVGTEAAFHAIDEYMTYVDEYYDKLEARQTVKTRKVYLASDDASVIADARKRFPNYEFLGDPEISKSAGLNKRYTDLSLHGIIIDIHFLSLCDYLVCTFSSQVCRVAYEIMQTMHGDASEYYKSLDDIFYYGGQNAHNLEAVEKHTPQDSKEIAMEPGDLIGIAGNHWDGYSKGINRRTGKTGLFPSYKTINTFNIVDLPSYPEADEHS